MDTKIDNFWTSFGTILEPILEPKIHQKNNQKWDPFWSPFWSPKRTQHPLAVANGGSRWTSYCHWLRTNQS